MAEIRINNLKKVFDKKAVVVDDFTLNIEDKEFIVLVGPSGCGKSTTLRMVAGLEDITDGELFIDNIKMNDVEPKNRDIAMVFQNYALYPHMTVYDNMAFALKLRKFKKDDIKKKVDYTAEILGLKDLLNRKPSALSGGQLQRVALGRAIVRDPKVFLMDEPLSNLDAKLRVQMRGEIQKLHRQLQATTIYVTHDQTEAMTMASRLVVMKDGKIQQIGVPKEVYDFPKNTFVGGFIGSPSMNFLYGKYIDGYFVIDDKKVIVPDDKMKSLQKTGYNNKDIILGIRPEDILDLPEIQEIEQIEETNAMPKIIAQVDVAELMGSETVVYSIFAGQNFVARISARAEISSGTNLDLFFDMDKCHFFDAETDERIKMMNE